MPVPLNSVRPVQGLYPGDTWRRFLCLALSAGRNNTAQDCRPDSEKTEWNLHIGYDYDFGPFVAGIVGEYGRSKSIM